MLENFSNPFWVASALINSARILLQQGHFEEALSRFKTGLESGKVIGSPELMAEAYNDIGWTYLTAKNWEKASLALEAGLAKGHEMNNPETLFYSYFYRAELALEQGHLEQAQQELVESEKQVAELGDPLLRGQMLRLKARLALKNEDYTLAESHCQESLAQLESLKAFLEMSYTKLYLAHTLWHKARLLKNEGQDNSTAIRQVRSLLNQAIITFEACEVTLKQEDTDELNHHLEQ